MTPILAAPSTKTNWPNKEFQALKTWDMDDACREVDRAIYYPIHRVVSVSIKIMGL